MLTITEIHDKKELESVSEGFRPFAEKLHDMLVPFEDTVPEIEAGMEYALDRSGSRGGFILSANDGEELVGALVMLRTNMRGYVPENLLLYVAVDGSQRGKGIGTRLIRKAVDLCQGDVKLHVEYDNPAKRLYERLGFVSKYADMRLSNE